MNLPAIRKLIEEADLAWCPETDLTLDCDEWNVLIAAARAELEGLEKRQPSLTMPEEPKEVA